MATIPQHLGPSPIFVSTTKMATQSQPQSTLLILQHNTSPNHSLSKREPNPSPYLRRTLLPQIHQTPYLPQRLCPTSVSIFLPLSFPAIKPTHTPTPPLPKPHPPRSHQPHPLPVLIPGEIPLRPRNAVMLIVHPRNTVQTDRTNRATALYFRVEDGAARGRETAFAQRELEARGVVALELEAVRGAGGEVLAEGGEDM